MDIAIFGAGIAGLMTAVALRAQGHRCRTYERMRQCQEHAGMVVGVLDRIGDRAVDVERAHPAAPFGAAPAGPWLMRPTRVGPAIPAR